MKNEGHKLQMKHIILSLFKGTPKPLEANAKIISSINRDCVDSLIVYLDYIEGDEVSNKQHHGGPNRVLHYYPSEHYVFWKTAYPEIKCSPGEMGENISSTGLNEKNVCIGDVYKIGEVELLVTEPRKPCGIINLQFQLKGMARRVQKESKTGWFFRVLKPGTIHIGDEIELLNRPYPALTIDICVQSLLIKPNEAILHKMVQNPILSTNWKTPAQIYLDKAELTDDRHRLGEENS